MRTRFLSHLSYAAIESNGWIRELSCNRLVTFLNTVFPFLLFIICQSEKFISLYQIIVAKCFYVR